MGSAIFVATPVGFSASESLLELLAVDGAGDSLPAILRSGVEAVEGSALMPVAGYRNANIIQMNIATIGAIVVK